MERNSIFEKQTRLCCESLKIKKRWSKNKNLKYGFTPGRRVCFVGNDLYEVRVAAVVHVIEVCDPGEATVLGDRVKGYGGAVGNVPHTGLSTTEFVSEKERKMFGCCNKLENIPVWIILHCWGKRAVRSVEQYRFRIRGHFFLFRDIQFVKADNNICKCYATIGWTKFWTICRMCFCFLMIKCRLKNGFKQQIIIYTFKMYAYCRPVVSPRLFRLADRTSVVENRAWKVSLLAKTAILQRVTNNRWDSLGPIIFALWLEWRRRSCHCTLLASIKERLWNEIFCADRIAHNC